MTTLADHGFEEVKVIGRGQYGKAHLVKSSKDESLYVAKAIDLTCLSKKERDTSLQEVTLLRRLSHPNIVDYKDSFFMGDTLVIIMEHCQDGDLASYIKDMSSRKMKLREVQIMKYFVQMLNALQYIHQERILHRDLKTSNLFLLKRRTFLKVGDFGISRVLEGSVQAAMTVVGTPYYMSPEVCENKPYTYKSDVWALGCVLYELCQLKHAFSADNLLGLVYKIVSDKYEPIPRLYSQALNALIQRTLEKVADKRPSVNDLLADPYVQSFVNEYARRGRNSPTASSGQQGGAGASADVAPDAAAPGAGPGVGAAPGRRQRGGLVAGSTASGPGARAWGGRTSGQDPSATAGGRRARAEHGTGEGAEAGCGAEAATGEAARPAAHAAPRGGPGGRGGGRGASGRGAERAGGSRRPARSGRGSGAGAGAGATSRRVGGSGKLEGPGTAETRRRREASIERKALDVKAAVRYGVLGRISAQKAKQAEHKPMEAAPAPALAPLEFGLTEPMECTAGGSPADAAVVEAEAEAGCPRSPANSSTESTTFEESTPKPNVAWPLQDGSTSPEHEAVTPKPAPAFGERRGSKPTPEREEPTAVQPEGAVDEEISDGMSSAEEYEDDFEEEYEGEEEFDKDYGSVEEEVDECSEIEEMEVGSVDLGGLSMVPEEEEYTRVMSAFEPDLCGTRRALVSPPPPRRVAADRVVSVGVAASVPGAAALGSTTGSTGSGGAAPGGPAPGSLVMDMRSRAARLHEELVRKMGAETFQKAFDFLYKARERRSDDSTVHRELEALVGRDYCNAYAFDVDQLVFQRMLYS